MISFSTRFERFRVPLILATTFLDLLGFGVLIPIFPQILDSYDRSGAWMWYMMAIYSLGSFIGGYFFGKLSDRYGRVPFLALGSVFNAFGYLLIIFAPVFWIFLLGRFVAGLAGGSIGVIQAYVSDISTPKDRSKNMGLIGAMFGLAFLVGPAIGGLLSGYGVVVIAGIGLITSFLNLVLIWVVLPEPRKHIQTKWSVLAVKWSYPILILLTLTFLAAFGFSPVQALSTQFYTDIFSFDAKYISYTLIVVGLTSIIYQGFLVKYIRKIFSEWPIILLWLALLSIGFIAMSYNTSVPLLWAITILFPLGMGMINPAIWALISLRAGDQVGKFLGINMSVMSLANIIAPAIGGYLYGVSPRLPFLVSGILFIVITITIFMYIFSHKKSTLSA